MESELYLTKGTIDSIELLNRFILNCKNKVDKSETKSTLLTFADIITAVYYYRRFPDANKFIDKFLKGNADYFLIQWVRTTWESLNKMTEEERSDLVMNQIALVANSQEEQ